MDTVPTASTKKMRVRSKSTSDVGDSQKNDFGLQISGVKGKVGLNGKAANHEIGVRHGRDKQLDRKSRTGLRGLPKKGKTNDVFARRTMFFSDSVHIILRFSCLNSQSMYAQPFGLCCC